MPNYPPAPDPPTPLAAFTHAARTPLCAALGRLQLAERRLGHGRADIGRVADDLVAVHEALLGLRALLDDLDRVAGNGHR
jgi:hypothetical protein